ncbi:metalloregulator ArsR/SmtB family transcription factor [Agromyces sp. H66]|uniref:ArsR/SmtB family transcription factor n=1 Tax=Agromyces sp. H66 TaxID=2529859 RepID=UPI0010AA2D6B|nr:metalloregulator ArsR/SmtB family transcription factor [Agromyces sp. H66]
MSAATNAPALDLEVLTALAEPNRLRIVELLREGGRPVGEIAETLSLLQPQTSRHLRILAEAGLVRADRRAQSRVYHLLPAPFRSLEAWLDTFGQVWETRVDRLDAYLLELETQEGEPDDE